MSRLKSLDRTMCASGLAVVGTQAIIEEVWRQAPKWFVRMADVIRGLYVMKFTAPAEKLDYLERDLETALLNPRSRL